jgi:hypothetical protein
MEKCFEYFRCYKTQCPACDETGETPCWEVQGTLCHHEQTQEVILKHNKSKCRYCTYYKAAAQPQ